MRLRFWESLLSLGPIRRPRLNLDTDVIDTALETYAVNFSIGEGLAGTFLCIAGAFYWRSQGLGTW